MLRSARPAWGRVAGTGNPATGGVTGPEWEREFADHVAARSRLLCTTAYLLCGDWHRAEDHTQTALTKLYLDWRRIDRSQGAGAQTSDSQRRPGTPWR